MIEHRKKFRPQTASVRQFVAVFCFFAFTPVFVSAARVPQDGFSHQRHKSGSEISSEVFHKAWDGFLQSYLFVQNGVSTIDYPGVTGSDTKALDDYLAGLGRVPVSLLSRGERLAFWINLYNALTVRTVLRHYPVASIFDIDISPESDGPWDKKLFKTEGASLSLNDIEHRILRPRWRDPRIHYALNCASVGCPNLAPVAYTADNAEALLEKGARDYVNHPRGAEVRNGKLFVSDLYFWFAEDFGGSGGVLEHVRKYADSGLMRSLREVSTVSKGGYDWSLNEKRRVGF